MIIPPIRRSARFVLADSVPTVVDGAVVLPVVGDAVPVALTVGVAVAVAFGVAAVAGVVEFISIIFENILFLMPSLT